MRRTFVAALALTALLPLHVTVRELIGMKRLRDSIHVEGGQVHRTDRVPILRVLRGMRHSPTFAKSAKCLLVVDNITYIDGHCGFESSTSSGSFRFSDKKMRLGCPIRHGEEPGQCPVAGTTILRYGTSGGLHVQRPGVGMLWWNGGAGLRERDYIGQDELLLRDGACWSNSRVKLCAWSN